MIDTIEDVVKNDLCVSCGACCFSEGQHTGEMVESKEKGIYIPTFSDGEGDSIQICPGKGYPIVELGKKLFSDAEFEDTELGRWRKAVVAHALSNDILKNASSGGVMTAIAKYLLDEKYVDGVITTKMSYNENGPRPKSFIATSLNELIEAQGSKYVPVPVFEALEDIDAFQGKLLFIGTPCQIAALRLLQGKNSNLKDKIPLTIGNFCGGYRDLSETDKIIDRAGFDAKKVTFLRYRGGGQPGSMLIEDSEKRKELGYPGYARMTGVIKYLRCRLCVDATAELADFSCGDAWLPKYIESDIPWSVIMARSDKAVKILSDMENKEYIVKENISTDDIKQSQAGNLISKKKRQASRMKLYQVLGYLLPEFDGSYYKKNKTFLLELKVHISHTIFSFLEKVHLYEKYSTFTGRYKKEK